MRNLVPIYPPPAIVSPGLRVFCSGCTPSHACDAAEAFADLNAAPGTYYCFRAHGDSHRAATDLAGAKRRYLESTHLCR